MIKLKLKIMAIEDKITDYFWNRRRRRFWLFASATILSILVFFAVVLWNIYQVASVVILVTVVLSLFSAGMTGALVAVSLLMQHPRRVGNEVMNGELYDRVLLHLKARKVKNPKQFIYDEEEYFHACLEVWRQCRTALIKDSQKIAALVYSVDKDPLYMMEQLKRFVAEFGVEDIGGIESMLKDRESVSIPLQEGVL